MTTQPNPTTSTNSNSNDQSNHKSNPTQRPNDLLIFIDATGSMGVFLESLNSSLKQIFQLIGITNVFRQIGIVSYKDYCDAEIAKFSGWITDPSKLLSNVKLHASGGGDIPEAAKTAANLGLSHVQPDANTFALWYADAPPHHPTSGGQNCANEKIALSKPGKIFDWVSICHQFKQKNVPVYPIINLTDFQTSSFYATLSNISGGKTIYISRDMCSKSIQITKITIKLLMSLMDCETDPDALKDTPELTFSNLTKLSTIKDENNSEGYLPKYTNFTNIVQTKLTIEPNSSLKTNLRQLASRFESDDKFKIQIYELFDSLLTPESIVTLTYNCIFATLWRLICKQIKDPKRDTLIEKLKSIQDTLKKTNSPDSIIVSEWIQSSYNQTFEVNQIILNANTKVPALVLDTSNTYSIQEILEINRSCSAHVLSLIGDLISHLRLVSNEDELPKIPEEFDDKGRSNPIQFIPLSLSDEHIFSILPHLMAPGTRFSKRPSLLMASVVSVVNNSILAPRAKQYLESVKGNWIDSEVSENYSGGFINLMLNPSLTNFLTEKEVADLTFYRKVFSFLINGGTNFDAKTSCTPFKQVMHDQKFKCDTCGLNRSFTLLTKLKDTRLSCGLCISGSPTQSASCPDPHPDKTVYMECSSEAGSTSQARQTCQNRYALVNVSKMTFSNAKCHYCRYGGTASTVKCTNCNAKFCDPARMFGSNFVCAQSQMDPKSCFVSTSVTFKDLYMTNKQTVSTCLGFDIQHSTPNLFGGHSVFTVKDSIKMISDSNSNSSFLLHKSKPILNSPEILSNIAQWINSGKSELGTCMICFSDFIKTNLHRVCGRRACSTLACDACLKSWYTVNKVGELVEINALTCPFCKLYPSPKILSRYNTQACSMVKSTKSFNSTYWYGWCLGCYTAKMIMEKSCSSNAPNLQGKFVCPDCQIAKPEDSKQCPGCQIAVVKNGGCNHMECASCKKHFCWLCCDEGFETSEETYEHLYQQHGGVYGNDDGFEDD